MVARHPGRIALFVFATGVSLVAAAVYAESRGTAPSATPLRAEAPRFPTAAATPSAPPSASPSASTPRPSAPVQGSLPVVGWHVPILMYHHISTEVGATPDAASRIVSPALFRAQMDALHAAGWHTITAAELAADLAAGIHPALRTFVVTIDDGHADGYTEAYPILQADGFVATYYVITGHVGHPTALSVRDVDALVQAGMEIGDHTVDHVGLALVPAADALREIVDAAHWIADLLGAAPTTLAYPYGNEDRAVTAMVAAAGFAMALTTREGCFESTADRFVVPRLRVGPWTTPDLLLRQVTACGYP